MLLSLLTSPFQSATTEFATAATTWNVALLSSAAGSKPRSIRIHAVNAVIAAIPILLDLSSVATSAKN